MGAASTRESAGVSAASAARRAGAVDFTLAGVRVRVTTDAPEYARFLKAYVQRAATEPGQPADVEIQARWLMDPLGHKRLPPVEAAQELAAIGSNAWLAGTRLVKLEKIRRRRFRFDFRLAERRLSAQITCHARGLSTCLERRDDALYANLSYYLVFYPLFWYLEAFRGTHLLHAAAVQAGASTMIVFGLDGAGKTLLTLGALGRWPQARVIADNLILHDGSSIMSCLQPVKVRHEHESLVPRDRLTRLASYELRSYYEPKEPVLSQAVERGLFLLPRFTGAPSLEPVDREEALRVIEATNGLPFEVETYDHYARLLNLLGSGTSLAPARREALRALLARCEVYRVGIGKGERVEQVMARIAERTNR